MGLLVLLLYEDVVPSLRHSELDLEGVKIVFSPRERRVKHVAPNVGKPSD